MWKVVIEARNNKNQVLKSIEVDSRKSYTNTVDTIDTGMKNNTERWVILYVDGIHVDEFLIE